VVSVAYSSNGPTAQAPEVGEGELCLGPLDQIPYGEARAFDVAGQQVAVFRLRNGHVYALSAVCPHKGGPIADGQIDDRIVLCPLHLNAFELATGCSTTGAEPLRRYDVRVDGRQLIITTPDPRT
jgi:nitrite reductase/ring-hydroxylating ferredoxin subunit